jgi:hypothetical protein
LTEDRAPRGGVSREWVRGVAAREIARDHPSAQLPASHVARFWMLRDLKRESRGRLSLFHLGDDSGASAPVPAPIRIHR